MKKVQSSCILFSLLMCMNPVISAPVDNVRIHGALVAEPCSLAVGDETIHLNFGAIVDKYLYAYQRTKSQSFTIHLKNCDVNISNLVSLHFTGEENPELKGFLAINQASSAAGIAIGLESLDGTPLPLNKTGKVFRLSNNDNNINIQAYIQGEPTALSKRNIRQGSFESAMTFTLVYE